MFYETYYVLARAYSIICSWLQTVETEVELGLPQVNLC